MHAKKPKLAKKWEKKTPKGTKLPTKVKKRKKNTGRRKKKRWLIMVKKTDKVEKDVAKAPVKQPVVVDKKELKKLIVHESGQLGYYEDGNFIPA